MGTTRGFWVSLIGIVWDQVRTLCEQCGQANRAVSKSWGPPKEGFEQLCSGHIIYF